MAAAVKNLREYNYLRYRIRGVPSEKIKKLLKLSDEELISLQRKYDADIEGMSLLLPRAHLAGADFVSLTDNLYVASSFPTSGLETTTQINSNSDLITLPGLNKTPINPLDLVAAFAQRRTTRNFANTPLSLAALAQMLWSSHGQVNGSPKRVVPSAGGIYPIQTYVCALNVENLIQGIYRYLPRESAISVVNLNSDCGAQLREACFNQGAAQKAPAILVWTGHIPTATAQYGQRGYRHLFIEAGHICQNLYLSSQLVNCGVCAISGFADMLVDDLLDLKSKQEVALYMAAIGNTNALIGKMLSINSG